MLRTEGNRYRHTVASSQLLGHSPRDVCRKTGSVMYAGEGTAVMCGQILESVRDVDDDVEGVRSSCKSDVESLGIAGYRSVPGLGPDTGIVLVGGPPSSSTTAAL
jgi:hypothetical protein